MYGLEFLSFSEKIPALQNLYEFQIPLARDFPLGKIVIKKINFNLFVQLISIM